MLTLLLALSYFVCGCGCMHNIAMPHYTVLHTFTLLLLLFPSLSGVICTLCVSQHHIIRIPQHNIHAAAQKGLLLFFAWHMIRHDPTLCRYVCMYRSNVSIPTKYNGIGIMYVPIWYVVLYMLLVCFLFFALALSTPISIYNAVIPNHVSTVG